MRELEKSEPDNSRKRKHENNYESIDKKNVYIGEQYTLIKNLIPLKVQKVERVLPDWLSNPIPVKKNLKEGLKSPKESCPILHPEIVKCLQRNKITKFFPVQQVIIPYILSSSHGFESRFPPRDICVATPTGSGKTLAFVVPIVQALGKRSLHSLSVVVILPVIELAKQVYNVFTTYASLFNLAVGKAFGEEGFKTEQEQLVHKVYDEYYSKVDILVATPGRLFDHVTKTPGIDFTQLRFLVLDEADKLLTGENGELIRRIIAYMMQFKPQTVNLGLPPFFPIKKKKVAPDLFLPLSGNDGRSWIPFAENEKVLSFFSLPFVEEITNSEEEIKPEYFPVSCPPAQRLLFSATLTHDPEHLQNVALSRPILFTTDNDKDEESTVTTTTTLEEPVKPLELTEEWVKTKANVKPLVLHYILGKERKKKKHFRCLVFAGSVELTSKLTVLLKALSRNKYVVEEFSSKFSQGRKMRINRFLKGKINVLVSTDAMARGIDIPDIDCVISYDVPSIITYTHRVGRTARAGNPGKAVSIVTEEEEKDLKKILGKNFFTLSERFVNQENLKKFELSFKGALETLSHTIKAENETGKLKKTIIRKKVNKKIKRHDENRRRENN